MNLSGIAKNVSTALGKSGAFLIFPLILTVAYSSFKRYFLNSMPSWGYEIPIFLYGISFLFGGAYCLLKNKHVNVDILPKYLSPEKQKMFAAASDLVIFVCCSVVLYYSVAWAWDSVLLRERSVHQTEFNPQVWWFKCMVPVSFFAVALQSLANIWGRFTHKEKV